MVIWMTDNSDNDINGDDVGDHDDNDDVYDDLSAQGTSCECPESQLSHELPSKDLPSLNIRMVKTTISVHIFYELIILKMLSNFCCCQYWPAGPRIKRDEDHPREGAHLIIRLWLSRNVIIFMGWSF